MKRILGKRTLWLFALSFTLLLALAGCTAAEETAVITVPVVTNPAPNEVVQARDAVLDFWRTSANECVPPEGALWRTGETSSNTPAGFGVFRFSAEGCRITVSYSIDGGPNQLYNVALGNQETGLCWQAVVDSGGHIVKTGAAAATEPGSGNPAALYCTGQGHQYEQRTLEDGTLCGVCTFPDGSSCPAWDFFYGDCAAGSN